MSPTLTFSRLFAHNIAVYRITLGTSPIPGPAHQTGRSVGKITTVWSSEWYHIDETTVPILHQGGWYDTGPRASERGGTLRPEGQGGDVIGAWGHGHGETHYGQTVSDLTRFRG